MGSTQVPTAVQALCAAALRRRLFDARSSAEFAFACGEADGPDRLRQLLASGVPDPLLAQKLLPLLPPADAVPFGPFLPLSHLADGGMGAVWLCRNPIDGALVVVKTSQPLAFGAPGAADRLRRRFEREASITSQLRHPNVVRCLASGATPDGTCWLALEYLPNGDLEDLIRERGPLPETVALQVLYQVADALSEAHRLRLVHRDLKPGNIFITARGEAKLADFGIARTNAGESTQLTVAGTVLGSPAFMSPEQVRGEAGVDIRADIYAAGCVLAFCLLGRPPYLGRPQEQMHQHVTAAPPDLAGFASAETAALVARCMAKSPADRFADPLDLRAAVVDARHAVAAHGGPDAASWFTGAALVLDPPSEVHGRVSTTVRSAQSPIRFREPEELLASRKHAKPATPNPESARVKRKETEDLEETLAQPLRGRWLALLADPSGGGPAVHCYAGPEVTLGKLARSPVLLTSLLYPIQQHADACHRIGRTHCLIHHRPGGFRVRDLNSANGTVLDGAAVEASNEAVLASGRSSLLTLAGVLALELRPCPRRADVPGLRLAEADHEALVMHRPSNRRELAYALVVRRVRVGGTGADLVLPGAKAGTGCDIALIADSWWWCPWTAEGETGTWRPLPPGTRLDCGGLSLQALVGDHRQLT